MGDLIKWIFSSTVKCVGKCGGEWVKQASVLGGNLLPDGSHHTTCTCGESDRRQVDLLQEAPSFHR